MSQADFMTDFKLAAKETRPNSRQTQASQLLVGKKQKKTKKKTNNPGSSLHTWIMALECLEIE